MRRSLVNALAESTQDLTTCPIMSSPSAPRQIRRELAKLSPAGILVRPQDDVAAAHVEPANHRHAVGASGHHLPMQFCAGSVTERSTATIEPAGKIGCIASSVKQEVTPIVSAGLGSHC